MADLYSIKAETLTNIADAIRSKTGKEDLIAPQNMATEIGAIESGGAIEAITIESNGTYTAPDGIDGYSPITVNVPQEGGIPEEAFVISGDCRYKFAYGGWDWFIDAYGEKITTKDITDAGNMFTNSNAENIPFEINCKENWNYVDLANMFYNAQKLTSIPKINGARPYSMGNMFTYCRSLRNLPEDIGDWFDWSYMESQTGAYSGDKSDMLYGCYSLRSISMNLFDRANKNVSQSYSYFYNCFNYCYALDELINLPIPYTATWTGNAFTDTFKDCYRLKNLTFAMPDGQPYTMNWKSQTIDLTKNVGSANNGSYITAYNSGITSDKCVRTQEQYEALKNDPDWYTLTAINNAEFSRYNHDSAVATINSLPDTSAYLATAGGTNTIKFKGAAGSATDGGAINTLTEEEIAVATAKGWTVTLA